MGPNQLNLLKGLALRAVPSLDGSGQSEIVGARDGVDTLTSTALGLPHPTRLPLPADQGRVFTVSLLETLES